MFSLANKTAIVTGGASGIGLAIAKRFIAAGARVLIADRRADGRNIADRKRRAIFSGGCFAGGTNHFHVHAAAETKLGCVEILINNAGIQPFGVGFDKLTGDLLRRTLDVNVNGVAFGIKHAAIALNTGGRVSIGLICGMLATPGATAYATSKAAVIHLTKLAAIELAPRQITVNAISPGTILHLPSRKFPITLKSPFTERRTPFAASGRRMKLARFAIFSPATMRLISPARTSRLTAA